MWTCKKCDTENEESNRFCVVCGLEKTVATEPAVEPTAYREPAAEPKRYTNPPLFSDPIPTAITKKAPEMAALQEQYDELTRTANLFKVGVILCVFIAFVLFAQPFLNYYDYYTIYNLALGIVGPIEQICSIVLLGFAILPAIFVLINFDSRKRNLPVAMSWVSLIAVAIYCGVIYFGNSEHNFVPVLIVLCFALGVFFATMYVKKLIERENVFYKTGVLETPKEPVSPQAAATREVYRPIEVKVAEPVRDTQPEPPKSRLKSTMR